MAGTFVVNGGNTTVAFSYVKPTASIQAIISSAAHYLTPDAATYAAMNNQQKLNVVDEYVKKQVMAIARTYDIAAAVKTADETATATADSNIVL